MMRLKVETLGAGLHPSEIIVSVKTLSGKEHLVVSNRSIDDGLISVGWPLGKKDDGSRLVELPRETQSGAWRVWVPASELEDEERLRA